MRPADEILREVFAERAGDPVATTDMYGAVLIRRRRHRRRTMMGASLAATVVVGGVAVVADGVGAGDRSLPAAATPKALASCIPTVPSGPGAPTLPPAVPVSQLPRQDDVRGSLAGDRTVVDAAMVAGWRGIRGNQASLAGAGRSRYQMDKATFRLRFVERAGAGTLALATAADRTGKWQATAWVVGQGTKLVPVGGEGSLITAEDGKRAQRFYGDDPLYVTSYPVCGETYGVVLAPRDATATLHAAPHIGADARPIPGAVRPLPLASGLAVFRDDGEPATVAIARGATVLGTGSLASLIGLYTGRPDPLFAMVDQAVKDAPTGTDKDLVRMIAQSGQRDIAEVSGDSITGIRVLWAGPTDKGLPAAVVAMTLPSGATYVTDMWRDSANTGKGSGGGLVPAGQVDRTLYAFADHSAVLLVVPKGATRAEIDLAGGRVQQVALHNGGAFVVRDGGAKVLKVLAFDSDGNRVAEQVPNEGLVHPSL